MASFQGIEVLPGKEVGLKAGESDVFHLSMAALPHGSRGSATIYATVDGSTFAVATLNTDAKITQVGLDLIFPKAQDPVFSVKGSTKVHLTGYTQSMDDGDMDDEDMDEEDMDEEESELPVTKAMNKAALRDKIQKSIGKKDAEEEDEEDDEDDEEDGEIDEDGEEDDVDGIDEDDEEDDEEDEEEEPPRKGHRVEGGSRGGDRGGRGGRGRY